MQTWLLSVPQLCFLKELSCSIWPPALLMQIHPITFISYSISLSSCYFFICNITRSTLSCSYNHLLIFSVLPHYCFLFSYPSIHLSIPSFISIGYVRGDVNSPNGVMCLQVMVGSGFPLAVQMRDTLLPSFTVMSGEMSYILGGTTKKKKKKGKGEHINKISISKWNMIPPAISSICTIKLERKSMYDE